MPALKTVESIRATKVTPVRSIERHQYMCRRCGIVKTYNLSRHISGLCGDCRSLATYEATHQETHDVV